jgi:sec-independent protein translocase protein TatA
MFGSFGWMELVLILIIVLIIFGAGKIPQLGEGLGKAIKGFKKSVHEPDPVDVTAQPAPTEQTGAPSQLGAPPQAASQPELAQREPAKPTEQGGQG